VRTIALLSAKDRSPLGVRMASLGFVAIALAAGNTVYAQTAPDAGALQRQIEQEQRKTLPDKAAPQFELPPAMTSVSTEKVTVNQFRFAGNTLLTDELLRKATHEFANHPIDFAGLQNAARAVAVAYRNAGWVVRTYLPQQDITGGTVTIQVVEAKFGVTQVEGKPGHISAERLEHLVASSQASGAAVNAASLDRALLLIDDLPGVSATGHLAEGKNVRETDLVLTVTDAPLVTSNLYVDNSGARFTGVARGILNVSLNSPFHFGDRGDVQLLHSEGADYMHVGYSVPVFNHGWRVGINASHFSYKIVADEFKPLDAHGDSNAFGLETSYPLIRARLHNLYVSFAADQKSFNNKSLGATTTDYKIQTATLGLSGNVFDEFAGGGASTATLSVVAGKVNLDGSPNQEIDALTTKTAGSYNKVQLSITRLQTVTDRFSVYGSLTEQIASKNLDSSEKLYLGGANGVRAYPANEAGGSEGWLFNFEGRVRLPAKFNFTAFYDHGSVKVNKDNDIIGAANPNTSALKGVGVSLNWRADFGLSLKATVAHRIGSNPNATVAGTDQDGSLIKNRFWIQAALPF